MTFVGASRHDTVSDVRLKGPESLVETDGIRFEAIPTFVQQLPLAL